MGRRPQRAGLVLDERSDTADQPVPRAGPVDGSLICVPLRGRDGATGVLTLERLGLDQRYSEEEFELVKLFAAQVSIALQNAEVHRAVEIRAQTDDLTGAPQPRHVPGLARPDASSPTSRSA